MHADGQAHFSRGLQARVDAAGLCKGSREAFRVAVGVQVTCARGGVGRREARRQGVERQRVPAGSAHRGGRNLEQRRREARHEAAEERPNIVKSPPELYIFAPGLLAGCWGRSIHIMSPLAPPFPNFTALHRPFPIMGLNHETLVKEKCIRKLEQEINRIDKLSTSQLKEQCKDSIEKPMCCKKAYVRQLNRLLRRFNNTTNYEQGGKFFQQDIKKLEQVLHQLLDAGLSKTFAVEFKESDRDSKRQCRW